VQHGGFFIIMTDKKSFILHLDSLVILDKMTNEQAGILLKAIYEYQTTGQVPQLDFAMDMAFTPFLNQFIRDDEKYNGFKAKQVENGKKGGRPKNPNLNKETQDNPNNPSLFLETQKSLNKSDSINDSINDSISKNKNKSNNVSKSDSKENKPHLFSESIYFDFALFEKEFENTDYAVADLRMYYESVKNWSESEGAKKLNWIATARNFIIGDLKQNKLIYKNGTTQSQKQSLDVKAKRDAALRAEFEKRRNQQ
jgi:hypothetical protein